MESIAFGKRVNTPLGTAMGGSRGAQPARRLMMAPGNKKIIIKKNESIHF